jgi:hypothetical protein
MGFFVFIKTLISYFNLFLSNQAVVIDLLIIVNLPESFRGQLFHMILAKTPFIIGVTGFDCSKK